tara:strand:+ start:109296 stop:109802 length:507 start_codon:yes stop_codon:yes gene_type:complete
MKITLLAIGKTDDKNLQVLTENYKKRLKHYIPFSFVVIPDVKNAKNLSARMSSKALAAAQELQKQAEGEEILKKIETSDTVILLDEKGKSYHSVAFSEFLQKKMNSGLKNLVFVIGGPYGFSDNVYQRANGKIALSQMTFSHQMVRLFFIEQLYRGFTILRNEPYHHR